MVVAAWIVAVWLLSLVVFVALRARRAAKTSRTAADVPATRPGALPSQREPQDSPRQVTDRT